MMDSLHSMSGQGNPGQASAMPGTRPRAIMIFLIVWILIQMIRITAYPIVQDVQNGIDSPAWLFPALMDMFIGMSAPFLAYTLIRKTGLWVWTSAIVWFVLSISDHIDALITTLTVPLAHSMSAFGPSAFAVTLLINTALDAIAVVLLTRARTRAHYLSAFRSALRIP